MSETKLKPGFRTKDEILADWVELVNTALQKQGKINEIALARLEEVERVIYGQTKGEEII